MKQENLIQTTHRRGFIGTLAATAATLGLSSLPTAKLTAGLHTQFPVHNADPGSPDEWFDKIKGKHRIVFDATHPAEMFPFAWPRVFLLTNQKTGSPASDCGVVVVLRHGAIPFAFESSLWEKYKFGEMFKVNDPVTMKPSVRNAFWQPAKGAFKVPGFGEISIGINELQEDGVMFCVCDAAITVYSAAVAEGMKMEAADIKKDWLSHLLPGIQVVPSGVWAVGRAQEHRCSYCFVAN
jgi:intracellular sulfur oxidation DsrE/DsrF family protein